VSADNPPRLAETENVIDEHQRVFACRIAEVFGHSECRKCNAKPRARRLVHLAEDHAGLLDNLATGLTDFGLLHFDPQVGPFARPLTDACEDRVAAVRAGDASDQLLQNNRFAQTGSAEQAGFAAANKRREQVDNLDARFEHFRIRGQISHLG
jgi:hypothetical protein